MGKHKVIYLPLLLLGMAGCIEPFQIKEVDNNNTLVVEGFLSNTTKEYQVTLSRSAPISESKFIPEPNAKVWIKSAHGDSIVLTEEHAGIYKTPVFGGRIGEIYTLFITTNDGHEYASEAVTLKATPEIDKIYAAYLTNQIDLPKGIHIYLDTHDPLGKTRYYKWDYIETYEILTPSPSNYIWLGGNDVVFRDMRVDQCWGTDTIKNILIKTTAGLESDKVSAFRMRFISQNSYIFRVKYSVLVRQYALSEQAYLFWENLRIMNENQGSLSDVQPGTLPGNMHSLTDDTETVLGYFDASSVSEKRVFFRYQDFIKDGYERPEYRSGCYNFVPIEAPQKELGLYMERYNGQMSILDAIGFDPFPVTFLLLPKACCDCTDLGTNIKPSFWE